LVIGKQATKNHPCIRVAKKAVEWSTTIRGGEPVPAHKKKKNCLATSLMPSLRKEP